MKRKLTPYELEAVRSLANALPISERDQILSDINRADVEEVTPDGSRIQFHIAGYIRPTYHGQHPLSWRGNGQGC